MKSKIVNFSIALVLLLFVANPLKAQDIVGSWGGKLSIQGNEMPLMFNIAGEGEGYSSTMDSPSQGAMGIPMDETTFVKDTLTIKFKQSGIKYVGTFKENSISGIFYQGTTEMPLSLEKTEKKLPGNTALPTSDEDLDKLASLTSKDSKYAVEDYFARPKARTFRFSPEGTYLSYREKDDNLKNHVYVKNIESGDVKRQLKKRMN